MQYIRNKRFGQERALYNTRGAVVENCRFEGEEDGESFLKESAELLVKNCFMDLRYPMWHCDGLTVEDCEMTANCRAALWYDKDLVLKNCKMNGIKAVRECKNVALEQCGVNSPEFGWRCENIAVKGGTIASEYAFFESKNIRLEGTEFSGKYSFQYTENVEIANAKCKTKDAFWHSKNVTVRDSLLDGEYIGWYSEGLTLINCHIKGTQPFCYCKHLRLVNCTTEDCDLSFEYSDAEADIRGDILSVKNPLSGTIAADSFGEIILSGSKYPCNAKIVKRK